MEHVHHWLWLIRIVVSYMKLINIVMSDILLDPMKVVVSDEQQSVSSQNKKWQQCVIVYDAERYRLWPFQTYVDVVAAENGQQSVIFFLEHVPSNVKSSGELFSMWEKASVEPSCHSSGNTVTVVTMADTRDLVEGIVFRNKEILKMSFFYKTCLSIWLFELTKRNTLSGVCKMIANGYSSH